MSYTLPSIDDFKNYFVRDFPYGTDLSTSVLDVDISNAMVLSNINMNQEFFPSQEVFNLGFLYLSAHFLVTNLRASSQGKDGQYNWIEQSKAVGSVNTSYAIPEAILENPYWAMLTKTNYGAAYINLLLPQLSGQMFTVLGATLP